MKNLVLVLFVSSITLSFSQPNFDSLNKLPFYHCPTTFYDLSSFDLNKIYDLDNFSELLSIRYGCVVGCDHFFDLNGHTEILIYLRPTDSEMYECSVMTTLSIAENLFKRGVLLENVNLYYEICRTTSEN